MLHRMAAAALQQIDEAVHVAFHVGKGIFQGVAHACLTGQVDGDVERAFGKELFKAFAVFEAQAHEAKARMRGAFCADGIVRFSGHAEPGQTGRLEAGGIVVVDFVYARHAVAHVEQPSGEKVADEAGRAGNKYVHKQSFFMQTAPRSRGRRSREARSAAKVRRELSLFCIR